MTITWPRPTTVTKVAPAANGDIQLGRSGMEQMSGGSFPIFTSAHSHVGTRSPDHNIEIRNRPEFVPPFLGSGFKSCLLTSRESRPCPSWLPSGASFFSHRRLLASSSFERPVLPMSGPLSADVFSEVNPDLSVCRYPPQPLEKGQGEYKRMSIRIALRTARRRHCILVRAGAVTGAKRCRVYLRWALVSRF